MKKLFSILLICLLTGLNLNAKPFTTTQDINVRAGEGISYQVLGVIKKGTTIDVTDINGKWGKVKFDNSDGFISTNFLKASNENTSQKIDESNEESNTYIIYVLIGFTLLIFFLRKTRIAKYLAPNMSKLFSSHDKK